MPVKILLCIDSIRQYLTCHLILGGERGKGEVSVEGLDESTLLRESENSGHLVQISPFETLGLAGQYGWIKSIFKHGAQ